MITFDCRTELHLKTSIKYNSQDFFLSLFLFFKNWFWWRHPLPIQDFCNQLNLLATFAQINAAVNLWRKARRTAIILAWRQPTMRLFIGQAMQLSRLTSCHLTLARDLSLRICFFCARNYDGVILRRNWRCTWRLHHQSACFKRCNLSNTAVGELCLLCGQMRIIIWNSGSRVIK